MRLDVNAEPAKSSYTSTFAQWTREGAVVSPSEFDTTLLVKATLRSRAFQQAYAERYLKIYRISDPAERARVEQTEMQLADSGLNFWVRTASHNYKLNDLTPQRGRWRIALLVEPMPKTEPGQPTSELMPEELTPVVRNEGIELALFDQELDVFSRVWHLRFPPLPGAAASGPRKLTLRFAGPDGKTDLIWLVE